MTGKVSKVVEDGFIEVNLPLREPVNLLKNGIIAAKPYRFTSFVTVVLFLVISLYENIY